MYLPYNVYVREIDMMEQSGPQLSSSVCVTTVTRHAEDYSPLFRKSEVELSTLSSEKHTEAHQLPTLMNLIYT